MAPRAIKEIEKTYPSTSHLASEGLYLQLIPKQDHQLPPDSGSRPSPSRTCLARPDQRPPCLLARAEQPPLRPGPRPLATSALARENPEWDLRRTTPRRNLRRLPASPH